MPEHDETTAPEEHKHQWAASPPSFREVCAVCGRERRKADRFGVEDKVVDSETK